LFGGAPARRKSSIDRMAATLIRGEPVKAFSDRTLTPTHVTDVVAATRFVLSGAAPSGLLHCVSTGVTTWLELALSLADLLGRPRDLVTPARLQDAALRAPRPLRCALSNARLVALGLALPRWQDALARAFPRRG